MTCSDKMENTHQGEAMHISTAEHHQDHNEADDCSPFCVCQCCHTSPVLLQTQENDLIKFAKMVSLPPKTTYSASLSMGFPNTIKEPPRA